MLNCTNGPVNDQNLRGRVLYLLGVLPGPVDVVAPGDDDGELATDAQSDI